MESECHKVVVEEKTKVINVDIFPKSGLTEVDEITLVQMDARPSLR